MSENFESSRYKYIRLHLDERLNGTPSNDPRYQMQDSDLNQSREFQVHKVTCPNVFENIHDEINTFVIRRQGQPADDVITVQVGQYDINQLIANLKGQIDALIGPDTISITLNPVTNKLTFTTGVVNITYYDGDTSPLSPYLGILSTSLPSLSITADAKPDLGGTKVVFFHSKELALSRSDISDRLVSSFCSVSFGNVPFGYDGKFVQGTSDANRFVFSTDKNIRSINVRLRDAKGRLLDPKQHNYTIVLKAYY
jgi:hypothetical protein